MKKKLVLVEFDCPEDISDERLHGLVSDVFDPMAHNDKFPALFLAALDNVDIKVLDDNTKV